MHPQVDALLARLLSTGVVLEDNVGVLLHPDYANLPKNRTLLARSIYLKLISATPLLG